MSFFRTMQRSDIFLPYFWYVDVKWLIAVGFAEFVFCAHVITTAHNVMKAAGQC